MIAEAIMVSSSTEVAAKLGEMATYAEMWRYAAMASSITPL